MLASGVALYELRREAEPGIPDDLGIFCASGASLHTKTFAVDGDHTLAACWRGEARLKR
jgi:hypothetical protein